MKTKNWVWIGIAVGLLLVMLELVGFFYPLNAFIPHRPDVSCTIDADCAFQRPDCDIGCSSFVANKDWEAFCPFHDPRVSVACAMRQTRPACVENRCRAVPVE